MFHQSAEVNLCGRNITFSQVCSQRYYDHMSCFLKHASTQEEINDAEANEAGPGEVRHNPETVSNAPGIIQGPKSYVL